MKTIIFLLIFLLKPTRFTFEKEAAECESWRKAHVITTKERHYSNITSVLVRFKHLHELNVACHKKKYSVEILKIYADESVLLDSDLNLQSLLSMFEFTSPYLLQFLNVKGFNLVTNGRTSVFRSALSSYAVNLQNARLHFYIDSEPLTSDTCLHLGDHNEAHVNFFGALVTLIIDGSARYEHEICPYVFLDSFLTELILSEITNSLLLKNRIRFTHINRTDKFVSTSAASLRILFLSVAYETISQDILHPHAFKHAEVIYLVGVIYRIQTDLFSRFVSVKFLHLNLDNFAAFYHAGTQWLRYLNMDLWVNVSVAGEFRAHKSRCLELGLFDNYSIFKGKRTQKLSTKKY